MDAPPAPDPALTAPAPLALYVHIPFCAAKCRYCDFTSRPALAGEIARYVAGLCEEIRRGEPPPGRRAGTVFFGGGTPTLLGAAQFEAVLDALRGAFRIEPGAEISVEANPGSVDMGLAARLHELGVNRVSLGVQSLRDPLLRRLGRPHSSADAVAAFGTLRAAGFRNLGADLIYGLPSQDLRAWEEDLARLIALGPEHLSLYALSVEEGTPFAAEERRGTLDLPPEEEVIAMHRAAARLAAAAGYRRYEISNFARPGFECRHNLAYWTMAEYRGFGAGAHSFLRRGRPVRCANDPDPERYRARLAAGESPQCSCEELSPRLLAAEALMLGLRLADGVSPADFARDHGAPPERLFSEALAFATAQGWSETVSGRLRLTPDGVLFSNEIFRRLF